MLIGHTAIPADGFFNKFIYSFHMPAFFMVTGILSHWGIKDEIFIIKRVKSYVIPYFSWSFLLFIIFWFESPFKFLARVFYGGAMNTTTYTFPFWFICCLFVSAIIFNYCYQRKYLLFVLALGGGILVHYLLLKSWKVPSLPWSLEVFPFACMYFMIGIYAYKIYKSRNFSTKVFVCTTSILISASLIILHVQGLLNYSLTMKNVNFTCFPLDVFVPLCFFFALKTVSSILCLWVFSKKVLSYVGNASIVIMFSHATIFHIIEHSPINGLGTKLVFSLTVGCLIYCACTKNKYLSLLFTGKTTHK